MDKKLKIRFIIGGLALFIALIFMLITSGALSFIFTGKKYLDNVNVYHKMTYSYLEDITFTAEDKHFSDSIVDIDLNFNVSKNATTVKLTLNDYYNFSGGKTLKLIEASDDLFKYGNPFSFTAEVDTTTVNAELIKVTKKRKKTVYEFSFATSSAQTFTLNGILINEYNRRKK